MNNRLQKKCFIAAAGFHLLLVVILFVGPAFLSSGKPEKIPPLDFTPSMTIEKLLAGGGNPNPRPPAAQPQAQSQPQPRVQESSPPPQTQVKPEPSKPVQRDPDALAPTKQAKKLPDVVLKPVIRPKPGATKAPQPKKSPDTKTESSENAESRLASTARNAANSLRGGLSSSTNIKIADSPDGPGGGGPSYAGYSMVVERIYTERYDLALLSAGKIVDEQTSVEVAVIILRNGNVLSARIVNPSRNDALNKLVQRVLDSVTFIREFPADMKDSQQTFNLIFDLKPKKALG